MRRAFRRRYPSRFAAAYALLGAAVLAAGAGALLLTFGIPGTGGSSCAEHIPTGRSVRSAWKTTELFVADVMLSRSPACGYDLSTQRLRGNHGRDEWGTSRSPVHAFSKRYPVVPVIRASRDPHARQAVYVLSRRVGSFVVLDERGRATIPMIVGVAAPGAGRGAYNLLLVVEHGSWRVDEVRRVHIDDSG